MKLINKLDETLESSMYSGRSSLTNEVYLRPIPKKDENGIPLKSKQRYYVFRMLFFENGDRKYPFIVRNEHEYYKKDSNGKIIGIKRICCPTTLWAKNKIQEATGKDYCPICKYSMEQNAAGWKNFRQHKVIDKTCLEISRETEKKWAVYIPVLVVSDPAYQANNFHLKVLRLSGDEGRAAYDKLRELIKQANADGYTVFNGGEGVNVAMLCEKETRVMTNKRGETVIDQKTGKERTYTINAITDIRLLTKNLQSYPQYITEAAINNLRFDETYAVPATKDQLSVFLADNYMDSSIDANFGDSDDGFDDDDFSSPEPKNVTKPNAPTVSEADVEDDIDDVSEYTVAEEEEDVFEDESDFSEDDIDDDEDESTSATISRLTKGKVPQVKSSAKIVNNPSLPPDIETIRDESTDFSQDDLPF